MSAPSGSKNKTKHYNSLRSANSGQEEKLTSSIFFVKHKLVLDFFEELSGTVLVKEESVGSFDVINPDLNVHT
jgi:hypothetical protein